MNTVNLIGRNTKPPETRYNGEMAICRFNLAVSRMKTQNNPEPGADFISCVCFGKTAQNVEKYITSKGRLLGITGHIQTGSYENSEGHKIYTTDVICDRIEFLDRAPEGEKPKEDKPVDVQVGIDGFTQIADEDIPF